MSDSDLGLLECLRTVHSMVPSHEELFREAADHIEKLEATLKSYRSATTKQEMIIKQYRRGVIDDINRLLEEIRSPAPGTSPTDRG